MPLTVTFAVGPPCSGGNHFDITATAQPSGATVVVHVTKPDLRVALSAPERELLVNLSLRAMVNQMTGQTPAQIKAALEAKTLDLTLTG